MAFSYGKKIVTDGLVFCLDAAPDRGYNNSTTMLDLVKNNNGSMINGTQFDPLNGGGSVFLDGTNDRIDVDNFNEDSNQDVSIFLWVNNASFDAAYTFDGYDLIWFVGKRDNINDDQWQMSMRSLQNQDIWYLRANMFNDSDDVTIIGSESRQILLNNWYYIGISFRSSDSLFSVYMNGELDDSATLSGSGIRQTGSRVMRFGRASWNAVGHMNGNIGPVHIYNRALSDSEIRQNYLATKGRFA